jgi:hypothetical protein
MAITKREFARIAEGFKYVADDPTADHSAVVKMITEFDNAAVSLNPNYRADWFHSMIFGGGRAVANPWTGKRIECGACGYDLFYNKGRSLDYNYHECQRCFHVSTTMTETGMSA